MASKGYACAHEKERLEIMACVDELSQEKDQLEKECEALEEQLQCIEKFLSSTSVPAVIFEAIEDKEKDILYDQRTASYRLFNSIDPEIADWLEELEDEKKRALEDGCPCVKNFEC